MMISRDVRILLHDIRSAHNVGAIFRTADAAGISHIYFSGYTPRPTDRFGRPVKEIAKTALGAEKIIPWTSVDDPMLFILGLKNTGFTVVGIEQDIRAIDYKAFRIPPQALVLVGNEVDGLSNELRNACDTLVEISMAGKKESLNVAVAFGIAVFRMLE